MKARSKNPGIPSTLQKAMIRVEQKSNLYSQSWMATHLFYHPPIWNFIADKGTAQLFGCLVTFCTFLLCFQMLSAFCPCFVPPICLLRQVLTMLQSGGKNTGKSVCDQSSAPWNIPQSTEMCVYLKPFSKKLFQAHVCVSITPLRIAAYDTICNYMHTMSDHFRASTLRKGRRGKDLWDLNDTEAPTCAAWCPKGNLDYDPVWWWGICWTWMNVRVNVGRCCRQKLKNPQSHYSHLILCTHSVHYWWERYSHCIWCTCNRRTISSLRFGGLLSIWLSTTLCLPHQCESSWRKGCRHPQKVVQRVS